MIMRQLRINLTAAVAVVSFALLAGCSSPPTKQQVGLVTGGVAGAAIGSLFGGGSGKIVATGVGAVGGALIGSEIGKSMEEKDQQNTTLAMNNGLQESSWKNPKTGNVYTVEPNPKMYVNNEKQVCRQFNITLQNGGKSATLSDSGVACQNANTAAWNVA